MHWDIKLLKMSGQDCWINVITVFFFKCSCDHLYEEIRVVGVSYIFFVNQIIYIYHAQCRAVDDTEVYKYIGYCKSQ